MKEIYQAPVVEQFKEHPVLKGIWVGNCGTILSTRKGRKHMDPYGAEPHRVSICEDGRGYLQCSVGKIHRLVAQVWIPNPDNLPEVNHKDEDKTNSCVENLEWCTSKYNTNYGTRNARASASMKGNQNGKGNKGNQNAKGHTLSAEHRAKLSAANKGKPKSAETRAKMSASMKAYWEKRKSQQQ